jgi:SAM-dependent methyltransferase
MKYYQGHEQVYQKLQHAGKSHWGERVGGQGVDIETAGVRRLIDEVFARLQFTSADLDALDLGCGSGVVSHLLASRGFRTLGIDVSPTAIAIAQKLALDSGLSRACFATADIVNYTDRLRLFDLIIDACCLHCIVFDDDRAATLRNVRELLKPHGIFAVNTKTKLGMTDPGSQFVLDDDDILWVRTPRQICENSVKQGDAWLMPQRRAFSPERLLDELAHAGFTVDWHHADSGVFAAICRVV